MNENLVEVVVEQKHHESQYSETHLYYTSVKCTSSVAMLKVCLYYNQENISCKAW